MSSKLSGDAISIDTIYRIIDCVNASLLAENKIVSNKFLFISQFNLCFLFTFEGLPLA